MKNGKILSTESYPELYMHLELCENYLTEDQFSEEELHVNKFQVLFVPGIGTLPNVGGKVVNVVQGIIKAGGAIKLGKDSLDKINNAPVLNASEETELDTAREKGESAKNHKKIKAEDAKNLKGDGEPNSSVDLLNPDGSVKQRRYYGPDGRAVEDIDYNHSDDGTHEFPYRHQWDWNKRPPRQKGE